MKATLIYVHDPMCSWCWGFAPIYSQLLERLPAELEVKRLLGGLAGDTNEPMPESMRLMLQQVWHRIEEVIPGVQFNFDFWTRCEPRRSTYPACRAVIAARAQGEQYDAIMTGLIQDAYYRQAKNPSENATLIALAEEIGLSIEPFSRMLVAPETQQQLVDEINQAHSLGINGFPSLVLQQARGNDPIAVNYTQVQPMLDRIESSLGR